MLLKPLIKLSFLLQKEGQSNIYRLLFRDIVKHYHNNKKNITNVKKLRVIQFLRLLIILKIKQSINQILLHLDSMLKFKIIIMII